MTAALRVALHLLQSPRLVLAAGASHILERKDAALLALLAIHGPTNSGRAAGLLWPDGDEPKARSNLRQRLFRLRKVSGTEVVVADGALHLAPGIDVDVLQFATALLDDPHAGAGELLGSLDYGGLEALDAWVTAARQRWQDQRHERLVARASELEASQQIAAALVLAQRIVADEPLQEHAHRRVMRLHYLRGDSAAALTAYQTCRDVLRHELGAQPNRETDDLAALVEAGTALRQPAPAPRAIATLRPPRLVGREEPWHRLERAYANAALVLVEGEAGIGKTRLLGDFASAHRNAPLVSGRPGDSGLPYALLTRLLSVLNACHRPLTADWVLPELARLTPLFGVAAQSPTSTLRLQQAVLQAFAEWQAAGLALLVVDDLHYADAATLEMLPAIVAASQAAGVAWLIGARHGELPAAAAHWLFADEAPVTDRIALDPLDLSGVRELLDSLALPGLDAACWAPTLARHTGGNPLFLLETLIAMLDGPGNPTPGRLAAEPPALPAPERIGRLIERRLGQLSTAALKLARVAAIAGLDFNAALAAQVLGLHALDIADSWRELETAGVIRDNAFAHDLIFEGALRSIPQAIARLLHRDVSRALEGRGAPASRLALHWEAAEEWAEAGRTYEVAAGVAFAASRRVEEADLWDRAVRCYERSGDETRAFTARRDSIDTMAGTRAAEDVLHLTETLLATAGSPSQRLDALICHARPLMLLGRFGDAAVIADEAVALSELAGDAGQRLAAANAAMTALVPGPRAHDAIERMQSFATQVESDPSSRRRLDFYTDLATSLYFVGRRTEAVTMFQMAISLAQMIGDAGTEIIVVSNYANLLSQLGHVETGRATAERACHLLEQVGDPIGFSAAAALNTLGQYNHWLGRFDLALSCFTQALDELGGTPGSSRHITLENGMALTWLMLGQPARALQALKPISDATASQAAIHRGRRRQIEARIYAALGKPNQQRIREALGMMDVQIDPVVWAFAELDASRGLEPATALAACQRVQEQADAQELLAVSMRARLYITDALRRVGRSAMAADSARRVMTEWRECRPADLYWPEALWIVCQALREAGDLVSASSVLQEAVDWIAHIARSHVPVPFRDSFLQRNVVNRDVLAEAGRCDAAATG